LNQDRFSDKRFTGQDFTLDDDIHGVEIDELAEIVLSVYLKLKTRLRELYSLAFTYFFFSLAQIF
jgi:hypothetical protein